MVGTSQRVLRSSFIRLLYLALFLSCLTASLAALEDGIDGGLEVPANRGDGDETAVSAHIGGRKLSFFFDDNNRQSATDFDNPEGYAEFVVVKHTRRRRGRFHSTSSDSCSYGTGEEVSETYAVQKCQQYLEGKTGTCHSCDDCTTFECIQGIPGCVAFLQNLYDNCLSDGVLQNLGCLVIIIPLMLLTCLAELGWRRKARHELESRREFREEEFEPENIHRLQHLTFLGTITELNKSKEVQYELHIDEDGSFEGTRRVGNETRQITGDMRWAGDTEAEVRWQESRGSLTAEGVGKFSDASAKHGGLPVIEFSGDVMLNNGSNCLDVFRKTGFDNLSSRHIGWHVPEEYKHLPVAPGMAVAYAVDPASYPFGQRPMVAQAIGGRHPLAGPGIVVAASAGPPTAAPVVARAVPIAQRPVEAGQHERRPLLAA
mmetsp:Transcript_17967/g.38709  ORF Transcript_17967/g.38709 Transcript_17967/m.38709 type:complete len:431 (+) Transcript_17967:59-1351(+)